MDASTQMVKLDPDAAQFGFAGERMLVFAALGMGMPATVEVLLNGDPTLNREAAVVSWAGQGTPAGFVAIAQLPPGESKRLRTLSLRIGGRILELALHRNAASCEAIFTAIAEEAGTGLDRVVDGLIEILLDGDADPARIGAAVSLVRLAARGTGFIELIGADAGEVFIQGWAADPLQGRIRVLSAGEPARLGEFACASYERTDLAGRGRGFAGIFEQPTPVDPASLTGLFYRTEDGWRGLDLYQNRTMINPRDIPGHLRGLLPAADSPPVVLARLRQSAHRFDGRETVSGLQEPVKIGVDLAVRAEGGSILVAGWMIDPTRRVRSLRLRTGRKSATISDDWTRLPRNDVSAAFVADPLFRGLTADTMPPGFLAVAQQIADEPGEASYLELDLGADQPPRYFPLAISQAPLRQALRGLIAAIDLRSGAASSTVERQFGPLLRSIERQSTGVAGTADFGFDDTAPVALVIGADDRLGEATSLLALLAADPSTRSLPIVLAAPAEAMRQVAGEIERLTGFYNLSVRLVLADGVEDVYDAIEAGVAACRAGTLALMSADILPGTVGWLQRLLLAHRLRGERFLVSPTILFDDKSVRWAGAWIDGQSGRPEIVGRNVGFPRAAIADATAEETSAGTLECCVLARVSFEAAGGFSRGYLGASAKNLDMALRIRLAGTPSLWLPEVEMFAAESDVGAQASQLIQRIDRWSFDHRWSLALANLRR